MSLSPGSLICQGRPWDPVSNSEHRPGAQYVLAKTVRPGHPVRHSPRTSPQWCQDARVGRVFCGHAEALVRKLFRLEALHTCLHFVTVLGTESLKTRVGCCNSGGQRSDVGLPEPTPRGRGWFSEGSRGGSVPSPLGSRSSFIFNVCKAAPLCSAQSRLSQASCDCVGPTYKSQDNLSQSRLIAEFNSTCILNSFPGDSGSGNQAEATRGRGGLSHRLHSEPGG